jgi:hypothetical protein
MDDTIAVTLVSAASPLAFRLAELGGGEAQVAQLIVSDAASGAPVWWIVSQPWAEAVSFTPAWIDVTANPDAEPVPDALDDDAIDPIEDLPPSDPRHQAALRGTVDPLEDLPVSDPRHQDALRRLRVDELALRQPLALVTYGIVPPGFREVYPGTGDPQPLSTSSSYVVLVDTLLGEARIAFSLE